MQLLLACTSLVCGPGTYEKAGTCLPEVAATSRDSVAHSETGGTHTSDSNADSDDTDTDSRPIIQVYLLAGQSNMDGYAVSTGLPPSLRVGQPDVPLYWSGWGHFAPLAPASYGAGPYMGPEVVFGRIMADSGQTVALVKHAVGGTDLYRYWAPGENATDPVVGEGWKVLVESMDAATAELDAAGEPWEWAGLLWMQGESDALNAAWAAAYEANLSHFIARVREQTRSPDLPAVIGMIACEGLCHYLEEVRAAETAVADADANVVTIETLDLPRNPSDTWHYDGPSARVLGERFAAAFLNQPPPAAPMAALALSSWTTNYDGEYTVGWRFTTSRSITLTDIGGFGSTYLYLSQEYGLWDATGILILRGTIPGWYEAPTSWRDGFWYTAIEPVELPPGDYVIGLVSWTSDRNSYADSAVGVVGEGISYVEARYVSGYWLSYPAEAVPGALAFAGPGFLYR